MRTIGQLQSEDSARRFSDFLYVEGINNEVEPDQQRWTVWIHSEDDIEKASELLRAYQSNPNDSRFQARAHQARALKEEEEAKEVAARNRMYDRKRVFKRTMPYSVGPATIVLVLISVGVAVLSDVGSDRNFLGPLLISEERRGSFLPEVMRGELWRLVTPIFIHFGFLHIIFNMLWMLDLGSMIETRQGTWKLLYLVAIIGAASNLGQYWQAGPVFGGMSGVVYGLLGYIWMKGRFDPGSGLSLHPQTVTMMLIWFFLCLFEVIPGIANTAHAVGLVMGMIWGYISSLGRSNRLAS